MSILKRAKTPPIPTASSPLPTDPELLDLELAIRRGWVDFGQIASLRERILTDAGLADLYTRALECYELRGKLDWFEMVLPPGAIAVVEARPGGVFGRFRRSRVMVDSVYSFEDPVAESIFADLQDLAHRARTVMRTGDANRFARMAGIVQHRVLVAAQNHPILEESSLAALRRDVDWLRSVSERAIDRGVRLTYFIGTLAGFLPALCLSLIVADLLHAAANGLSSSALFVSAGFGAVGAVVSVSSRLRTKAADVDLEAGRNQILLVGLLRPFVGALFASLTYLAIEAQLLGFTLSGNDSRRIAALSVVGFVAGLNERWAEDLVLSAVGRTVYGNRQAPREKEEEQLSLPRQE